MDLNNLNAEYYPERVPLHAAGPTKALLVGIAPGPQEAISGFPMIGSQGGTLYRFLCKAEVSWAKDFEAFSWPIKMPQEMKTGDPRYLTKFFYPRNATQLEKRLNLRQQFLDLRAQNLAVSNSVPYWPFPKKWPENTFADPHEEDVLADANLDRFRNELNEANPDVLFLCGYEPLMLVCGFQKRRIEEDEWSQRVGEHLKGKYRAAGLKRLRQTTLKIIYLGHPNRWNFGNNPERVLQVLKRHV